MSRRITVEGLFNIDMNELNRLGPFASPLEFSILGLRGDPQFHRMPPSKAPTDRTPQRIPIDWSGCTPVERAHGFGARGATAYVMKSVENLEQDCDNVVAPTEGMAREESRERPGRVWVSAGDCGSLWASLGELSMPEHGGSVAPSERNTRQERSY